MAVLLLVATGGVLTLVLLSLSGGTVSLSRASQLDFQTPPPPADENLRNQPYEPDPTAAPLAAPLTADQALALALEMDAYGVEREKSLDDSARAAISVTLHESPSSADAAIGQQTWYLPDIEADVGAVWNVTIPGRARLIFGIPGDPSGGTSEQWHDVITYQFSVRTGMFLGLSTVNELPDS
jgi:hypothetical protein